MCYVSMARARLIPDPDPKLADVLEMVTHFTSSESKSKDKRCHAFLFKFSSLERSLYSHDKFEV